MYRWLTALVLLHVGSVVYADTNCSVSTLPNGFGNYDQTRHSDSTSGSVTVQCRVVSLPPPLSGIISYTIGADMGTSGSFAFRRMTNLSNPSFGLTYNLYVSGSRQATAIWGDGNSGTQLLGGSFIGLGTINSVAQQEHVIYGRVPSGQGLLAVGTYSDSLVITLTF